MRFRPCILLAALLVLTAVVAAVTPAVAAEPSFSDVPSSHPYALAIQDLADRQIINGFADGRFGPDDPVTRQQFAKMIVLALALPVTEDAWPDPAAPFVDLGADDPGSLYPHDYVAMAAVFQITKGKDATHFAPLDNISRAQVITMVVRAAQNLYPETVSLAANVAGSTWGDFDPTHALNAAVAETNGLLAGLGADTTHPSGDLSALRPFARMSRGEVAQVLHNLLKRIEQTATPATPSTESTTTTETTTEKVGDLMHFSFYSTDGWRVENVSTLTGVKVTGPPLAETGFEPSVFAAGTGGRLLHFSPVAKAKNVEWKVEDLGAAAGKLLAGPLTTWRVFSQIPGTGSYAYLTHLAGAAKDGDLLHFWYGQTGAAKVPFTQENITSVTGQKIQGDVANYSYPTVFAGHPVAEHVVARSPNDDLLLFWDLVGESGWSVVNISSSTGRKVKGAPVAWVDYLGDYATCDHIAAVDTDGHLLHFSWTAADGWKVEDLTALLSGPAMAGPVALWESTGQPPVETINLAAVDENGHVLHFWQTVNNADWLMTDVSVMTHQIVVGPVAGYGSYADLGLPEWYHHIVAARSDGHVLVFTQVFGTQQWQASDVSAITSDVAQGPFAVWRPTFLEAFAYPSGIAGVKW